MLFEVKKTTNGNSTKPDKLDFLQDPNAAIDPVRIKRPLLNH